MSKEYIMRTMTDIVNGKEIKIIPVSLFDAIKKSLTSEETLDDVLNNITPIIMPEDEYIEKVRRGEITETDKSIYYVPDDTETKFSLNDSVISKQSTFSSKKLAEIFASINVDVGGESEFSKTYAKKAKIVTVILKSGDWVNKNYTLTFPDMNPDTVIDVSISNTLSDAQYKTHYNAYKDADIFRVKKQTNTLIFVAQNKVPTMDITLDITVF